MTRSFSPPLFLDGVVSEDIYVLATVDKRPDSR